MLKCKQKFSFVFDVLSATPVDGQLVKIIPPTLH